VAKQLKMEKHIGVQIGIIAGSFINALWIEPLQCVGVYILVNIGYWCRVLIERLGNER
jgi:hypothetical protein